MAVNLKIVGALNKAVMFGMMLQQHDEGFVKWKGTGFKHIPKPLVRAALTSFTLQIVSTFDEGLEAYIAAELPPKMQRTTLGRRIRVLKDQELLKDEKAAKKVAALRNRLAHKEDQYATWEDWYFAFHAVRDELGHLGVAYKHHRQQKGG
jgi:hypothetical protein